MAEVWKKQILVFFCLLLSFLVFFFSSLSSPHGPTFASGGALQVRVAGVQLLYNTDVVGAALGFVNELQHHSSRVLERTSEAGDEHGRPHNLTERVLHSFARHDIPVDRPVSLPLVSVDMYCPGRLYLPACVCIKCDQC